MRRLARAPKRGRPRRGGRRGALPQGDRLRADDRPLQRRGRRRVALDRIRVKPLELAPNQIGRFYRGGRRIAAFRGLPASADDAPEDWIASTTHTREDA